MHIQSFWKMFKTMFQITLQPLFNKTGHMKTMDVFIPALQFLCYSGNFFSGMIARNIYRMQQRTLFNKMFLIYFSIDCIIGMIHPVFLFQLFRERYNTNKHNTEVHFVLTEHLKIWWQASSRTKLYPVLIQLDAMGSK